MTHITDTTSPDTSLPTVMKRRRSSTTSPNPPASSHIISATTCSHCGTTSTPLWRRAPNGDTICNACGLYLKTKHTMRPVSSIATPAISNSSSCGNHEVSQDTCSSSSSNEHTSGGCGSSSGKKSGGSCGGAGQCNGLGGSAACAGCPTFNNQQLRRQQEQQLEGLVCANCATTTTPLWRRDDQGNTICNACGLYYKLHKVHRPVSMKRNVIKRRKRMIMLESQPTKSTVKEEDTKGTLLLPSSPSMTRTPSPASTPPPAKEKHRPIHTSPNNNSIPAIEDFISSSRFPLRQQQQQAYQPLARGGAAQSSTYSAMTTPIHHHLPSFNTMDTASSSSSHILLPPIQGFPTPPSPPLSISSLLSSSSSPSSSPSSVSPPTTNNTPASLSSCIQRLDVLNKRIAAGGHHHQIATFITQLDQLVSQAESTFRKE